MLFPKYMRKRHVQTLYIVAQLLLLLYGCSLRLKNFQCNIINSRHLVPT